MRQRIHFPPATHRPGPRRSALASDITRRADRPAGARVPHPERDRIGALALLPDLLFLVALISVLPVSGLLDAITGALARVAPGDAISIVHDQVLKIAHEKSSGLLTLGMIGTIWSVRRASM